jgi:hypothetical protein
MSSRVRWDNRDLVNMAKNYRKMKYQWRVEFGKALTGTAHTQLVPDYYDFL